MFLMSSKTRRFILSVLVSVGLTATAMPMRGLPKLPHASQPQTTAANQELDLMLEKFFNGEIDEIPPQEYPAVNVQPVNDDNGNDAPENGGVENREPGDKVADIENLITERNLERSEGVNSAETANRSRGSVSEQEGVPPQTADAPSEKMLELLNAIEQEQLNGDPEPDVVQNDGTHSRSRSKAESSAKMQGLFNAIDYAQELDPALEKFFNGEVDEIRPYEHKTAENQEPANEATHASRKRSREIEENIEHGLLATSIPVTYTTVGRETEFPTEIERLKSILPRKYDTTSQKETVKSAIKFIDEMNGVETVLQEPDELEFLNIGLAHNAKMTYLLETLVSRLPGTFQLKSASSRKNLPGYLSRNRAVFEARHYIAALKTVRKPKHANNEQKSQTDNEHVARGGERHNPDVSIGNARNHGDHGTSVPPLKRLKLKLPQSIPIISQGAAITQQPFVHMHPLVSSASQQQLFRLTPSFEPVATPAVSQGSNIFSNSNQQDEYTDERKKKNDASRKERVIQLSKSYQRLANLLKMPNEKKPEVILQRVIRFLNRNGYHASPVDHISDIAKLYDVLATQLPGQMLMQRTGGTTPFYAMSRLEALTKTIELVQSISAGTAPDPGVQSNDGNLAGQSTIPQMPTQPTNQQPGLMINSYAQSTVGLTAPLAPHLLPTLQMSVPVTAANYGSINHANVNAWFGTQLQQSLLPSNSMADGTAKIPWQIQNQYIIQSTWDLAKLLPSRYNPKTKNDVLIAICDYIDESTGNKKEEISLYPKGSFRSNNILINENLNLLYRQLAQRLPDHPQLSIDSPGGITKYELMDRVYAYVASLKK